VQITSSPCDLYHSELLIPQSPIPFQLNNAKFLSKNYIYKLSKKAAKFTSYENREAFAYLYFIFLSDGIERQTKKFNNYDNQWI
jgi:hypothetical protein